MELAAQQRLDLFYYMRLMRAIEDRAWVLSNQGRLVSRLYTGHGQEAIPVGSAWR